MKIKKAVIIGIIVALVMVALSLVISLADAHKSYESESDYEIVDTYSFEEHSY